MDKETQSRLIIALVTALITALSIFFGIGQKGETKDSEPSSSHNMVDAVMLTHVDQATIDCADYFSSPRSVLAVYEDLKDLGALGCDTRERIPC